MPLTSADRAFGIIAVQRKLLTKEALAAEEKLLEEKLANGINVPLAQHLITAGKLDVVQRAEVERIRSKHGRSCEKCARATFLLPGESADTKPCEHCGGKLGAPLPVPGAAKPAPAKAPGPPAVDPVVAEAEALAARVVASEERLDAAATPIPVLPPEPPVLEPPPRKFEIAGLKGADGAPRKAIGTTLGPLTDEALAILAFPLKGRGPVLVAIMAVCAAVASIFSFRVWGLLIAPVLAPLLIYLRAYQVKLIERTIEGDPEPPDWPDWEETIGLGLRLFLCNLATALPAVVLFVIAVKIVGAPTETSRGPTVGPLAHMLASRSDPIHGKSAAETELYDTDDNPVKVGDRKGRWLVMALIEKDDTDDTGMSELIRQMPKIGSLELGVTYFPGLQVYDLDRFAKALPDVDVAAVFIDPRWRKILARGLKDPSTLPGSSSSSSGHRSTPQPEKPEEDDEEGLFQRPKVPGVDDLPIPGSQPKMSTDVKREPSTAGTRPSETSAAKRRAAEARAYQRLKVWRSRELLLPAPFQSPKAICPTVWIIDPQGVVRRQFDGGASDRAIYATYLDLVRGGNGDVEPADLPGARVAGTSNVLNSIFYLGLAFAVVYGPMAALMTVVFKNALVGFNYPAVVESIRKAGPDYAFLVGMAGAILVAVLLAEWAVASATARALPDLARHVVSGLVTWLILTYALMAEARAYGRFYVRAESALGWFDRTEPAPAAADANDWRAPDPSRPPVAPPAWSSRREPGAIGRALAAFAALPKGAALAIAAAGFVIGAVALRYEMQHQTLDSFLGVELGKLNRMRMDVKSDLVTELAKMGYVVRLEEIQLAVVEQPLEKGGFEDGSYAILAFVTVDSPGSGFRHQYVSLSRGGWGFEYFDDRSKVWPAPRTAETTRHLCIGVGFLVALAFLLKAFGPSILSAD